MLNTLHKFIGSIFRRKWVPKPRYPQSKDMVAWFKQYGEGLYISNMQSASTNIVSKCIRLIAGEETHSIILLYAEDLRSWFTTMEWERLATKYKFYYGSFTDIEEDNIKILVLGSADETGMNYPSFRTYQYRMQSIRKVPLTYDNEMKIVRYLVSPQVMSAEYDYYGLIFWFLRIADDERAYFCSEIIEEAFKRVNLKVSVKSNPSPHELEVFLGTQYWIVKHMSRGWPVAK